MAIVHLIRHGQASFGAADYDKLSPLGERQSALLGRWFARLGLRADAVVIGALERHRATAHACIQAWGHADGHAADAGFDEFHADDVIARAHPHLATYEAMTAFLAASEDAHQAFQGVLASASRRWIGGTADADYRESWPAFAARCQAALVRAVDAAGPEATLCIFSSAGVIGTLVQQALQLSAEQALLLSWSLKNTSLSTLRMRDGRSRLDAFNQVGHLEAEGDPALLTFR